MRNRLVRHEVRERRNESRPVAHVEEVRIQVRRSILPRSRRRRRWTATAERIRYERMPVVRWQRHTATRAHVGRNLSRRHRRFRHERRSRSRMLMGNRNRMMTVARHGILLISWLISSCARPSLACAASSEPGRVSREHTSFRRGLCRPCTSSRSSHGHSH